MRRLAVILAAIGFIVAVPVNVLVANPGIGGDPIYEEEDYFSALLLQVDPDKKKDDAFVRQDYCVSCWPNRPADIFSFWRMKLVDKTKPKTPREVLIEFFDNLRQPDFQPPAEVNLTEDIKVKVIYLYCKITAGSL